MNSVLRRLLLLAVSAFLVAACDGKDGAPGAPGPAGSDGLDAVDTGAISVTVTSAGSPVEGATVSTIPATTTADTDASGVAAIADVPIGVYEVMATIGGITSSETNVGVAAAATADVALSLSGVPGTVTGTVLAPDGTPVEGATVSAPGSADAVTDAAGAFSIDAVVREFLSVIPPAGSTLLKGGTRVSLTAGDMVDITLSGGPASDANFLGSDTCLLCHGGTGLEAAWRSSGHYRVVERSLVEMDLNGWPADPGAGLCSDWFDTGVVANIPGEPSTSGTETHPAYIRTCNDDPDDRFEVLFDSEPFGAFGAEDLVVPVYATYGGPGTAAGEISELQGRMPPLATEINGAWKQRYMVSIADLGACSPTNPQGTFPKNPKPAWVGWDTTQTCEDMLMLPIQFNQRTLEWVSYHQWEWYEQRRAYSKKCSGCHEVGVTLTADADKNVTQYAAVDYRIGCEKCHGPGSSHVAGGGDPNAIMNPNHMSVVDAVNVCGQCHSRGSDPARGAFGFPWREDVTDFDGNFVAGLHTLDNDLDTPEGYFVQKPGIWDSGFAKSHRQQYNSYLNSAHIDNPFDKLTCNDCHSPHSGKGGPFRFSTDDFGGNDFEFADNSNALMSNVRCLSCHASFGPFATLSKDDIAVYHISRGGSVDKNGVALAPDAAEQTSAEDLVEQAVKVHSGESAGMPLAPYLPENSHIAENFRLGEGPVGRCTSCHMTKTAKSGSWFVDDDGLYIAGDNSDHSFEVVKIQPNTNQPNTCGSCHASFRTKFEEPGGD